MLPSVMDRTMTTTVGELTTGELRSLIEEVVHDQLVELFGDPDDGLELRDEVRRQLQNQLARVAGGDIGLPLEAVHREKRSFDS
jgi:hypothetical protein